MPDRGFLARATSETGRECCVVAGPGSLSGPPVTGRSGRFEQNSANAQTSDTAGRTKFRRNPAHYAKLQHTLKLDDVKDVKKVATTAQ